MRSARGLVSAAVGASFAVAFLAYCGVSPSDAGPDVPAILKSGTRLRAETYTSPDGASYFAGTWWDEDLKVSCRRSDPGNGALDRRCAPSGQPQADTQHFADAACATPVAAGFPAKSATIFCTRQGPNSEGYYARIGAQVAKVYARDSEAACVEAHDAFTQATGAVFFACDGEPIAPETFVLFSDSRG
jgi:hypothetical protein